MGFKKLFLSVIAVSLNGHLHVMQKSVGSIPVPAYNFYCPFFFRGELFVKQESIYVV